MLKRNNFKKTYIPLFAFFISLLLFSPFLAKAYDGSYIYRSTVLGRGVEQFAGGYNRISGESSSFNVGENVYALTRVFNITDVQSFQIKHQLYRNGVYYKDYYSEYYQPGGRWWAETYAWNNLGNLPSGTYTLKVYSRKGSSGFDFHREVVFNVSEAYNPYPVTPPVNNPYYPPNPPNYQPNYNFNFVQTHTGTGVRDMGVYVYEIVNQKENFSENEPLYVIGRLSEIKGIDRFKMKYDLYLNGTYYRTLYSWEQKPNYEYWPYNYTWVNFGNLVAGNYTLQTSISINGGSYTKLDTKSINVYYAYYDSYYDNNYYNDYYWYTPENYYPPINSNYDDNDYYWNGDYSNPDYNYKKITTGVGITTASNNACGENFRVQQAKSAFYVNEDVKIVTELELQNVNQVEVRHDLHLNKSSSVYKSLKTYADCGNYYKLETGLYSDFGNIPRGEHRIKVYVRLNNGSWEYLDFRDIEVLDYAGEFEYEWTKIGTGSNWNGWYDYKPSISEKSNFSSGNQLSVLTKIDNTESLSNYQVRHELWRGNKIEKIIESEKIYISYGNKGKEYFWSNFNYLYSGSHQLKVLVRTNDTSYEEVDSKYFQVDYEDYSYNYYNSWY